MLICHREGSVQNALAGSLDVRSGATALWAGPAGASQNECPLCRASDVLGNTWKFWNHFCPQKRRDLQCGVGWTCFVGTSVCWNGNVQQEHFTFLMFQLKSSSICFERASQGDFYILTYPGEHATLRPGCFMGSWKSGHLTMALVACLCFQARGCSIVVMSDPQNPPWPELESLKS